MNLIIGATFTRTAVMASPKPAVEASYSSRGALRDLFTVFDADNSGSLDADEIVVLLEVRPAR